MSIYLIKDCFRIDGGTGECLEREYAADFARYDSALALESARNQYVSFQVVFAPESGKLGNATVRCSDLTGTGRIESANCGLFIEWFHRLEGRLAPDLLAPMGGTELAIKIPLDAERLPDQRAGAVWVDYFIPADAVPGQYEGAVDVEADGQTKRFALSVYVHDATVPEKSRITADLNNYADAISPAFPSLSGNPKRYDDGSFIEMERKFHRLSREHRSLFHNLGYSHSGRMPPGFAPELEGEGKNIRVKSWERFDEHFGPLLDGSAFADCKTGAHPLEFMYLPFHLGWPASYEKWGQKGYRTEHRRIVAEFVRHFEEKGWTSTVFELFLNHKKDYRFYPYTVDEVWYQHDEESIDLYYDIIKDTYTDTDVKFTFRMDSSNYWGVHSQNRFAEMCGFWVAGISMYNWFPESMEHMNALGNIVFVYGSVLQRFDESLLSLFTWPIHCVMTGCHGFTVWNTTGFGRDFMTLPLAQGSQTLFYPGWPLGFDGPLPSLRLKALRNYMQTADLAMTAQGTPKQGQAHGIINRHFEVADDSGWWRPKPDFVDTPPRFWDFGRAVEEAALPPMHVGRSPLLGESVALELYELLSETKREQGSDKPIFKYQ